MSRHRSILTFALVFAAEWLAIALFLGLRAIAIFFHLVHP